MTDVERDANAPVQQVSSNGNRGQVASMADARIGMEQANRSDAHPGSDPHEDERDQTDDFAHMSDAEILAKYADTLNQSILPDLPKIPGYHTFWATTTNARDSVQGRIRQGYSFIKASEIGGWEDVTLKTGDYAGVIGINEMIAMKIPLRIYNLRMKHVHHDLPQAEEEKIRAAAQGLSEDAQRDKGKILDEHGFVDNIVQKPSSAPTFAG